MAVDLLQGRLSFHLPVIFVSATNKSQWLLSQKEIQNLAFELGGIAHVVVEPSRTFSFALREKLNATNVYGGTLGIALPKRGLVRQFYLGWQIRTPTDLTAVVKSMAFGLRTQMPSDGWDWTELQEQALRMQRERDRNRLSAKESEKLYQDEIDNLIDRIKQLEEQLSVGAISARSDRDTDQSLPNSLVASLGPEIYPGEFSDRLRLAANTALSAADTVGLDRRTKQILEAFEKDIPVSPALLELREDLVRATKDSKRSASEVTALLSRHGYREKSDNKHIRLEAKDGYLGLDAITLAKTPSDVRGLTNLRKQIERTLGISKL